MILTQEYGEVCLIWVYRSPKILVSSPNLCSLLIRAPSTHQSIYDIYNNVSFQHYALIHSIVFNRLFRFTLRHFRLIWTYYAVLSFVRNSEFVAIFFNEWEFLTNNSSILVPILQYAQLKWLKLKCALSDIKARTSVGRSLY